MTTSHLGIPLTPLQDPLFTSVSRWIILSEREKAAPAEHQTGSAVLSFVDGKAMQMGGSRENWADVGRGTDDQEGAWSKVAQPAWVGCIHDPGSTGQVR